MRRFFGGLLLCALLTLGGAASAAAESITDFSANYVINPDGTVAVTETIIYDFEAADRHGIFRTLETDHAQGATAWYKKRSVTIEDIAVTRDGDTEPFTVTESGGEVEVKIGSASRTITGPHTYVISYVLTGALSYGPSGSEFYWNVTGNDWPTRIERASARVEGNEVVFRDQQACYMGAPGATDRCTIEETGEGAVTFTATKLLSGKGLTIAQELDPETVATLIVEETYFALWFVPFVLLCATGVIIFFVRTFRKHRPSETIIAQYEPYPGVLPMYTGVLYDGRLDPRDITAGLLYLAEQGFIKIRKTERKVVWLFNVDDYEIILERAPDESVNEFKRTALTLLFPDLAPGSVQRLSELKSDQSRQMSNYKILEALRMAIATDLKAQGFYEKLFATIAWRTVFILAAAAALVLFIMLSRAALPLPIFFILAALLIGLPLLILALGERRTPKGYAALHHLKGFKEFLSVTDRDRFAFHNAPAKNPETFMQYLPYAVAFGVEKEWAEVFKDVTIPNPSWYEGGSVGAFSATTLTSDLSTFSSSFASSSGTGGSSGGGSSGGGGGGGGGGSW